MRNVENAFNDENASGSMECATCRSGIENIADNRASLIDFTTATSKSQAGGGSEAICGKRGDTI